MLLLSPQARGLHTGSVRSEIHGVFKTFSALPFAVTQFEFLQFGMVHGTVRTVRVPVDYKKIQAHVR